MKSALILGAGRVARPMVRYLIDRGFEVTVATRTVAKAHDLIAGHAHGHALALSAGDDAALSTLIRDTDVAVSLLPAAMHVNVARHCIAHRTNMVTTSYVSPEMRALDPEARAAGVTILNELGVDPGIDHMSAMQIIDSVKSRGGTITSFRSYCGGLPAPDANDNPLGYKVSWSPRAVLLAAGNSARYLQDGHLVEIDGPRLFSDCHTIDVEGLGTLEAYPNRDSLGYVDQYSLDGIRTMYRGTLRNPGHCEAWLRMAGIGLFGREERSELSGLTYSGFLGRMTGTDGSRAAVAAALAVPASSPVIEKLDWLGLFSDAPIPDGLCSPVDILADRMAATCGYRDGERDMIVLVHRFRAGYPDGRHEEISSTLIDFGVPRGDSAMARTVSLPAAIATRLVADKTLDLPGVHIPVRSAIYEPVLRELADLGISCRESRREIAAPPRTDPAKP